MFEEQKGIPPSRAQPAWQQPVDLLSTLLTGTSVTPSGVRGHLLVSQEEGLRKKPDSSHLFTRKKNS